MFLKSFTREEKENFLELAHLAAIAGYDFQEPEETMIREFRDEMRLFEEEYKVKGKEPEEVLKFFDKTSERKKRAVFTELLGLVLCDNEFDKKEQTFIKKIKERFHMSQEKYDEIFHWVKEIQKLYKKGFEILDSSEKLKS